MARLASSGFEYHDLIELAKGGRGFDHTTPAGADSDSGSHSTEHSPIHQSVHGAVESSAEKAENKDEQDSSPAHLHRQAGKENELRHTAGFYD
jgi:hypothetical protein